MSTSLYGGLIKVTPGGQPIVPDLVLANRAGQKSGVINNVDSLVFSNHLANPSEISFDLHKEADGVVCSLWDSVCDFKLVYIPDFDSQDFNPWYELSVTIDEEDETVKHCEGVHLQEAELSQLTLNNIEINTETDIARDDYKVTIIYNASDPEASLLNRIISDKAPHYSINHVDSSIAKLQRTFSWDGTTIKDAFDDIAEEAECLFIYGEYIENDGKIHRTISVYDLNDVCLDCGERGSFTNKLCTKCGSANIKTGYGADSGIFINHENFANEISYSSNKDEIKNCFRLVAGDDLMTATIRNIMPSNSQYIWYLSDSVRADMSNELQAKLKEYDSEYEDYESTKQIDISQTAVNDYNTLVNKYKSYDKTLTTVSYPVLGYSSLTNLYYLALNLKSLLQTSLAPASESGNPTSAKKEIAKLTTSLLSPLCIQNASTASGTTVTSAIASYAKVYIDTSLYRVNAVMSSYSKQVWKGRITLTSYTDSDDTASTSVLTIQVAAATEGYIKTLIEKAMKKNNADASETVELFGLAEKEFKNSLSYYSVDNLNTLASIARACLDVLIEQGVAKKTNSLYKTLYLPYYNKSKWIDSELKERGSEVSKLRGSTDEPYGLLDLIERQRKIIASKLDLKTYLGDVLWAEFCSFRRDDEYNNDNFISDGLTDVELVSHANEFLQKAEREIIKSATLQHSISCDLSNFLLLKEQNDLLKQDIHYNSEEYRIWINNNLYSINTNSMFSSLLEGFDVGNWIRIEVDSNIYKLRLTDYEIDYEGLDTLDVNFSDVIYGAGYMSDTQSILSQAKSIATSYSSTVTQANKGSKAEQQITDFVTNGLYLTNKKIVNSADNQNILIDESGLLMREKNEYGDDYSLEQTKVINHGIYYTNDGWESVEAALGRFTYLDPESGKYVDGYGVIANTIVGSIILGNEVGIYNSSGSLKIDEDGLILTSSVTDVNPNLLTIQKENGDGTYTKYIYIDDEGSIKINSDSVELSTGESLMVYIENADDEARKVATNYLKFDSSNGLVVGNMTNSASPKTNISITDSAISFRDNETVLAQYTASKIYLGKNSTTSVLDLCDGTGMITCDTNTEIYWGSTSDNHLLMSSENSIRLAAPYSIGFDVKNEDYTSYLYSRTFITNNDGSKTARPVFRIGAETYTCGARIDTWADDDNSAIELTTTYIGSKDFNSYLTMYPSSIILDFSIVGNIYLNADDVWIGAIGGFTKFTPYYKPGDTITISGFYTAGFITTSGTQVCFNVPLCKPLRNVSSASCTSLIITARQGGKYLYTSSTSTHSVSVDSSNTGVALKTTMLNVLATMSNTINVVNNSPVGLLVDITIKLS